MRKNSILILSLFMLILLVSYLPAQRNFLIKTVISTDLRAVPSENSAKCPKTIYFEGSIKVNKAMVVRYQFVRSDFTKSRIRILNFKKAGTQGIKTSWRISKSYSGWVMVKIISPSIQAKEAKAAFRVVCKNQMPGKSLTIAQFKRKYRPIQSGHPKITTKTVKFKMSNKIPRRAEVVSDLTIKQIGINPYPAKLHKNVTFKVIVKNISNLRTKYSKACKLSVKLSYKKPYGWGTTEYGPYFYDLPKLASMESCIIEFDFIFHFSTTWQIEVKADGMKEVIELNESNNSGYRHFGVFH